MLDPFAREDHVFVGGRVGSTEWGERDAAPVLLSTGAAMTSRLGVGPTPSVSWGDALA
jgi:hypothetical protein